MNLKEIVFRDDALPIEQDEALFLMKEYIKVRKGVTVEPYIERGSSMLHTKIQLTRLAQTVPYMVMWFRSNIFI